MRALPLTDKSRPGGRPRKSRAPHNAFAAWLTTCGRTPTDVAKALKVSISTIYNARNGYFKPGRDLSVAIEIMTEGAVPVSSWGDVKARARKAGCDQCCEIDEDEDHNASDITEHARSNP